MEIWPEKHGGKGFYGVLVCRGIVIDVLFSRPGGLGMVEVCLHGALGPHRGTHCIQDR